MPKNSWKEIVDQIAYFCPVYQTEGDGTEIAYTLVAVRHAPPDVRATPAMVLLIFN